MQPLKVIASVGLSRQLQTLLRPAPGISTPIQHVKLLWRVTPQWLSPSMARTSLVMPLCPAPAGGEGPGGQGKMMMGDGRGRNRVVTDNQERKYQVDKVSKFSGSSCHQTLTSFLDFKVCVHVDLCQQIG